MVFSAAGASMMNGSQRTPAKARTPSAGAALLVVHDERDRFPARGVARALLPPVAVGSENTQSNTSSSES